MPHPAFPLRPLRSTCVACAAHAGAGPAPPIFPQFKPKNIVFIGLFANFSANHHKFAGVLFPPRVSAILDVMKQSTQPAPAPRRPRSVKRTILLVLLGLLLVAVALLALRIYRAVTDPPIILVERQPSRSAAATTNPAPSRSRLPTSSLTK